MSADLSVNGLWNSVRLHFGQAKCPRNALNSFDCALIAHRAITVRPVLEMTSKILDLALLQTGQKAVVNAGDERGIQIYIPENTRQCRCEFAAFIGVGFLQRPNPNAYTEIAANSY
jgi:hypothetical protein